MYVCVGLPLIKESYNAHTCWGKKQRSIFITFLQVVMPFEIENIFLYKNVARAKS